MLMCLTKNRDQPFELSRSMRFGFANETNLNACELPKLLNCRSLPNGRT